MSGGPPPLLLAAGAALTLHAAAAVWLDAPGLAPMRSPHRPTAPVTLRLLEAPIPNPVAAPPAEPPRPAHSSDNPFRRELDRTAGDACPNAADLDRIALPYSQPDWQGLDGSLPSGRPLRLRLHIDALGQVHRLDAVEVAAEDADLLQRLHALLSATRYVPARQSGRDVASCLDLSIEATRAD